ncbi:MAG: hypothetical protein KGI40_08120 [Xanthomonadaceae bacterium]|nr:hypothetical protein [Xanthomonadaceae bacterium]MDE1959036.1 hypothetical protein [Xanthomonadaceae bacterium]MDE2177522.1 hypothetical protein [Xanthomonadaceae bacterium]MDE2244657.1 hypothetical protein [Xanthomonadaceae bacterium]
MLALATRMVRDYGKVLASLRPQVYGLPESLLPHPKERLRAALRLLLTSVPLDQPELREGLLRGYVYLAQFVPDAEAALIARGQALLGGTGGNGNEAEPAMRAINRIKLAMEAALEEAGSLKPPA